MASLRFVVLVWLAAVGAACSHEVGKADAGAVAMDAGPATNDAGTEPCAEVRLSNSGRDNFRALLSCLRASEPPLATKKEAIGTYVSSVQDQGGFPMADGDQRTFVLLAGDPWDSRSLASARVTGSYAQWGQGDSLAAEAAGFFHATVTLTAADRAGAAYKLVLQDSSGNTTWIADPLARRFGYDANGEFSLIEGKPESSHLERMNPVHATQLGNDREVDVYLPAGYVGGAERYPVLYMHDGQNLFDPQAMWGGWHAGEIADAEITAGRAAPFIIVAPYNTPGRMDEYTHVQDDMPGSMTGGKGAQYADFLLTDLKPKVDSRYRTLPDRDHTGVLGSSLGGLISFYLGLEHPEVFRFVGGMSSTFDWGVKTNQGLVAQYAATADLGSRNQVFYLDSGGGPPASGTCAGYTLESDSDNYCGTVAMKDALVAKGINRFPDDPSADHLTPADADILHWWEPNAPHDEAAWKVRLFRAYRLFFRK